MWRVIRKIILRVLRMFAKFPLREYTELLDCQHALWRRGGAYQRHRRDDSRQPNGPHRYTAFGHLEQQRMLSPVLSNETIIYAHNESSTIATLGL